MGPGKTVTFRILSVLAVRYISNRYKKWYYSKIVSSYWKRIISWYWFLSSKSSSSRSILSWDSNGSASQSSDRIRLHIDFQARRYIREWTWTYNHQCRTDSPDWKILKLTNGHKHSWHIEIIVENIEKLFLVPKGIWEIGELTGRVKWRKSNPVIIDTFRKDSFNNITISVDLKFNTVVILDTNKFKFFRIIKIYIIILDTKPLILTSGLRLCHSSLTQSYKIIFVKNIPFYLIVLDIGYTLNDILTIFFLLIDSLRNHSSYNLFKSSNICSFNLSHILNHIFEQLSLMIHEY